MSDSKSGQHPYQNPGLPIKDRVADLLSRMTLEEKVAQTWCVWNLKAEFSAEDASFIPEKAENLLKNGIGVVARPSEKIPQGGQNPDPVKTAEISNAMQKFALENTRLGIPFLFHEEGLHGQQAKGATMFPQAIAMAGTFDTELVEEIYTAVAKEIRVRGAHHALTPVIDVARDPRWGRVEETFGEDPYLVSEMGKASVFGFQGRGEQIDLDHVAATAKHYAVHGQPQGGTNCAPANYSEREIREVFLKPFKEAVTKARIRAVMPSYNEVDGIPSHVNTWLLLDVLRNEWGFEGITVSDYYAVEQLISLHHVAKDKAEAARRAFLAGVDIECPDIDCYAELTQLIQSGKVPESRLDEVVGRILAIKFELGLFEHPYVQAEVAGQVVQSQSHRDLAYQAALKAATLLQNENKRLPLKASDHKKIAVIGPNAAEIHLGGYTDEPRQGISILEGLQNKLAGQVDVVHAEGCKLVEGDVSWFKNEVFPADPEKNRERIREAKKIAADADLIILAVGGNEATCREGWAENHLGDRPTLELAAQQNDLINAMAELGKPMVAVLINGRPLAIQNLMAHSDAILECWYLGQETGTAVADILFGDSNPGGKLPITFPRSVGHIPAFYNKKPSANRGYLFDERSALFPFGFGLSYTTFEFANLRLDKSKMARDETAHVSVDVTNTGDCSGDEVVQMYIRDQVSSVTRPVLELKGFKRITLDPGETRTVTLPIEAQHLSFLDANMQEIVEPGCFDILLGCSSVSHESITLEVTGG